jgi:hypothetical protein
MVLEVSALDPLIVRGTLDKLRVLVKVKLVPVKDFKVLIDSVLLDVLSRFSTVFNELLREAVLFAPVADVTTLVNAGKLRIYGFGFVVRNDIRCFSVRKNRSI